MVRYPETCLVYKAVLVRLCLICRQWQCAVTQHAPHFLTSEYWTVSNSLYIYVTDVCLKRTVSWLMMERVLTWDMLQQTVITGASVPALKAVRSWIPEVKFNLCCS
jgi:hypothetical protein